MKKISALTIIVLLLLQTLAILSPLVHAEDFNQSLDDWKSFNHDERNTRSSTSLVPDKIYELWTQKDIHGEYFLVTEISPPIIYEDKVLVAITGLPTQLLIGLGIDIILDLLSIPIPTPIQCPLWSVIYALDATNGELIWDEPVGFPGSISFAVSNGHVFVSAEGAVLNVPIFLEWGGYVVAFEIDTKEKIWDTYGSEIKPTGTITVTSGKVFVSSIGPGIGDESLYCLDPANGAKVWETPYTLKEKLETIRDHLAIIDNKVFFTTTKNRLYGLSAETKEELWAPKKFDNDISHPVLTDHKMIISGVRWVYALDINTGNEKWKFPAPHATGSFSPAAVADTKIIVNYNPPWIALHPPYKRVMYVLNEETGDEIWEFEPPEGDRIPSDTSPIIAADRVLLVTHAGGFMWNLRLYCLDYVNKKKVWAEDIQRESYDFIVDGPRVAQGKIFISIKTSHLSHFRFRVLALGELVLEEPDFLISASSSDFFDRTGETSEVIIEVKSKRDQTCTFWLDVRFKDSAGKLSKYDPPLSATLNPGETTTFFITWIIPEDTPTGFYQIAIDCFGIAEGWCPIYTDNLDWAFIFYVYKLNIQTPTSPAPAMAGDPNNPNEVLVSVEWIPRWLLLFMTPIFSIEIDNQPATYELVGPWNQLFGIYTLRIAPPTMPSEGLYDLNVAVEFKRLDLIDSDVEPDAVQYVVGPSIEPIDKGLAWLRTRQYGDGSWRSNVGVTGLSVLVFLNAGYDETDPAVRKAISYILSKVHGDGSIYISYSVYETSIAILPLVATRNESYAITIENAKNWLVGAQQDEDFGYTPTNYQYGGWTYWSGKGDPDLSNTQFALLALDAANLPKNDPTWSKAIIFTQRCQNRPASNDQAWAHGSTRPSYNDGGFIYRPWGWSLAGGTTSYGSMTGAGIWGLLLSGVPKTDERIVSAMNWVKNHYTWDANPGIGWWRTYYYYLSMSKALTMYGEPLIDGHDWYQELYDKIVGMQIDVDSGQGYWSTYSEDYVPDLTTAYAILSLQTRAVAPPVHRLSYLTFILRSNALIRIYDPEGRLVGYNHMTGLGENNVPTAVYSGPSMDPQYIVIVNPKAGTYKLELTGVSEGPYTLMIQGNYGEDVTDTFEYIGEIRPGEQHGTQVTVTAIVGPIDVYASPPEVEEVIDDIPPTTTINIGEPKHVDLLGNIYVPSATPFTLTAEDDPDGSGVASTFYRIYNTTYDTDWLEYTAPFYLTDLSDGEYSIDYYSTDNAGNVEPTNTTTIILDNTPPSLTVETPSEGDALQDGVTFQVSAWDLSAVASVTFSIQCAQGNVISPDFESMSASFSPEGKWELYFDTTQLPDGFYLLVVNGIDVLGNSGVTTVQFSIRNWACLELLPASESNKAGRTMPVKFSLRVVEAVDPAEPFVWNEELTIVIYEEGHPEEILQESTYGTTARDYRIDPENELYITNFKTIRKKPTTYIVEIYRKDMLIGSFEFSTVK